MKEVDIVVIGGGPAGLCSAISAASSGSKVLLLERSDILGGQLIKQTHMFFGSKKQYASKRGFNIPEVLLEKLYKYKERVEILKDATVAGIYEDGVVTYEHNGKYKKVKPKGIIVATGAMEKAIAFPNNDMPGIYGAGAVQTLMNVYGIRPGNKVLMVGAGNIGLIVSYQLLQAGVEVVGIVDAAPEIGGYLVHASKVRRMGVPIYTSRTVKEAVGKESLEKVVTCQLNEKWQPIENTEKTFCVDVMCISVGLSPLCELLLQAGCKTKYIAELGGQTPIRYSNYETTVKGVFAAGDAGGVEEASSAMVEGYLAGLYASESIGIEHLNFKKLVLDYTNQLDALRSGPTGNKIKSGLKKQREVY